MTIQIRTGTGTNDWQTISDPEICTAVDPTTQAATFTNVNKGEIYDGSAWKTFYSRITSNTPPAFSFVSATPTSVTVRVIASSSDNKKVYAYRTSNSGNFQSSPASPTTSTINQTFTFSDLTPGTSYNFSSYIAFYDAEGIFVEPSAVLTLDASTTSYSKTTPTTPTNTGTISSTKLSFSSSSSSNYSTNGVAAYIRFELSVLVPGFGYSAVQSLNTSILPLDDTTVSKTVQFTGLTANVPYYCRARTYYGSPVDSYSSYSSYSSATSTYPFHEAMTPFKLAGYTTDTNLAILTDINAYNNGDAKIQWESAYKARGAQSWLGITTFLGTEVVTGNSTSYYGQNFTVIESREYRFRARVYYETIDKYGPWSDYTGAVRGKTWTINYTGWLSGSASANNSGNGSNPSMGSDGNNSTTWFSDPYRNVTTYSTQFKILAYFSRNIYYNLNTYYTSSNHAIDENRPSVTTTVTSLRYGISSIARNTAYSSYVVLALDSASRCILTYADEVTVGGSSNSAFNQRYFVMYSSGATVFLAPRGTTPANVTSSSGGTLFVYKTSGNDVSIFGGTSNYYTKGDNYLTAFDYDYGADVPLSAAGGSVQYLVASTSKVSSRVTESFSANFTPTFPNGHRNAKLEYYKIQVGSTGTPRISNVYVDSLYQYIDGAVGAYGTVQVTQGVLNSPPYYISFEIDSAPYSDGLYYATVTEVQVFASYETLEDI